MLTIQRLKIYCEVAISEGVVKRATNVAIIVGTALNLINQWESIIALDISSISFTKLLLTYIVPFSVTIYTATVMKIEFHIGTKASVEADLVCSTCKEEIHVEKDELIPESKACGINTRWKLK